ncbi:hypothetical protein [Desulfovibrio gilichinskyi]|uniref:Uncharacterized protein n=1 Tax=Desulfovibrio gilichinskyi TaxID=1519643 RepID=A0A1X7F2W8_9BACT|nr:hypothetical protein [Desulfovibrio gilichinskyi]SMF44501.1 hypothetical protein SAMN06295933_3605 [Desulfovibrio gilichinskyi]
MSEISMEALRDLCRTLGSGGRIFSYAMIYEALSVDTEKLRNLIRGRCKDLCKSGELIRKGRGEYSYNENALTGKDALILKAAWRAIKAAKPGFSTHDIARRSGATYSHICKWFRFLVGNEYIKQHGRDKNIILYRATAKAQQTDETPLMPRKPHNPFESEKKAACELIKLFMLGDPYAPATQNKIIKNCRAILDRFENNQEVA